MSTHIEVKLRASKTCYLSNEPSFYLIIDSRHHDSPQRAVFLEDGFVDRQNFQPVASNQVIQCFDHDTGDIVHVIDQGSRPIFSSQGYSVFTTSEHREPYELSFISTKLQPEKKYVLRFASTTSISHWCHEMEDTLNAFSERYNEQATTLRVPSPSRDSMLWEAAGGQSTITFNTREALPSTPNVTVTLTAPLTYSLSKPFVFTLTFSSNAEHPITALADRRSITSTDYDINIRESTSPPSDTRWLEICRDDDPEDRRDFIRFQGTFSEERELKLSDPMWRGLDLHVGREYVLRHLPGEWWWTDESVDEVMTYLQSSSSLGLPRTEPIKFASAGEVKFSIVA